jgi:hypothetical protein
MLRKKMLSAPGDGETDSIFVHSETKSAIQSEIPPMRCTVATSQIQATIILTLQIKNTAIITIVANVSAFSKEANLILGLRFHPAQSLVD